MTKYYLSFNNTEEIDAWVSAGFTIVGDDGELMNLEHVYAYFQGEV